MAERTFPFSSYKTYLYKGATKLIDIKDFTEPLSPREILDTTVASSDERTFMPGIRERSKIEFTCNYVKGTSASVTGFKDLKDIEDAHTPATYSIRFGDNGVDGIFTFNAYLSVSLKRGGVNEVVEMVITLFPTSAVTFT